mmetsp:Transcript_55495/g.180103  ORF Transcript_55495/g.180103 Transcript_55495/m.180103 type:complete len:340 (+) Transcript_55495:113-1132(+)
MGKAQYWKEKTRPVSVDPDLQMQGRGGPRARKEHIGQKLRGSDTWPADAVKQHRRNHFSRRSPPRSAKRPQATAPYAPAASAPPEAASGGRGRTGVRPRQSPPRHRHRRQAREGRKCPRPGTEHRPLRCNLPPSGPNPARPATPPERRPRPKLQRQTRHRSCCRKHRRGGGRNLSMAAGDSETASAWLGQGRGAGHNPRHLRRTGAAARSRPNPPPRVWFRPWRGLGTCILWCTASRRAPPPSARGRRGENGSASPRPGPHVRGCRWALCLQRPPRKASAPGLCQCNSSCPARGNCRPSDGPRRGARRPPDGAATRGPERTPARARPASNKKVLGPPLG